VVAYGVAHGYDFIGNFDRWHIAYHLHFALTSISRIAKAAFWYIFKYLKLSNEQGIPKPINNTVIENLGHCFHYLHHIKKITKPNHPKTPNKRNH